MTNINPKSDAATQLSTQENYIVIPYEEYERVCEILHEPATPAPRLRAVLQQKPVWDD